MMTININGGLNIDVENANSNITIGEQNLITYITGSNSSLNPSIPDHNSRYIIVTASTASFSFISLPYVRETGVLGDFVAPAGYTVTYKLIDVLSGTGSLVIDGHHDYMDEQHSYTLTSYANVNYGFVTFVTNGEGDWFIVAAGHGKDGQN